jgi:class 3 adenylate cyclase
MEPQFRFCTSADGTRISFVTYGEGPPLFYAPVNLSSQSALTIPESRAFFDALASRVTLATCDLHKAAVEDMAAVADALGWQEFTLFANNAAMVWNARYLGRRPQRVTRLVWWNTVYAGMVGANNEGEFARAVSGSSDDYSNYRRRAVGRYFPDGPVRLQREYNEAWKTCVSVEDTARFANRVARGRVDDFLPSVAASTLVLSRSDRLDEKPTVIRMAALLPNSQVRFVAGTSGEPFPGHEPVVDAVAAFMGVEDRRSPGTSGTAVILFTDIADSTALTERMGDAAFRTASRAWEDGVRAAIRQHNGTPVEGKVLGDGVMGVFQSASHAIAAAQQCAQLDSELTLHIGLHAGDVIPEGTNVYGGAVNIASRICAMSAPGEILVSDVIRSLARTSAGVTFEDRGEHTLKGIEDPQRVYAVRTAEA